MLPSADKWVFLVSQILANILGLENGVFKKKTIVLLLF